jgi:hypothetical protein
MLYFAIDTHTTGHRYQSSSPLPQIVVLGWVAGAIKKSEAAYLHYKFDTSLILY